MRNKSHEICQGIVFHCFIVTIYVVNITAIGALRSCCSLADAAMRKAAPSHPRPPRPFWAVWPRPRPWGPCPWSSWWTAWNSWHSPGSRRETEVILWLFWGKTPCLMIEVFFEVRRALAAETSETHFKMFWDYETRYGNQKQTGF